MKAIRKIRDFCEQYEIVTPCPLRIGHGIAFAKWLPNPDDVCDQAPVEDVAENLKRFIMETCVMICKLKVPTEVNLTSNRYLQATSLEGSTGFVAFVNPDRELKPFVVLATDNDDIWPTLFKDNASLGN